mmetsp:Transcript_10464/g.20954  ORF Transcript_10464/g.20954 Transcript_10464/m.20954 type:complete len:348 (-) Transcript_10464:5001-6044(-)
MMSWTEDTLFRSSSLSSLVLRCCSLRRRTRRSVCSTMCSSRRSCAALCVTRARGCSSRSPTTSARAPCVLSAPSCVKRHMKRRVKRHTKRRDSSIPAGACRPCCQRSPSWPTQRRSPPRCRTRLARWKGECVCTSTPCDGRRETACSSTDFAAMMCSLSASPSARSLSGMMPCAERSLRRRCVGTRRTRGDGIRSSTRGSGCSPSADVSHTSATPSSSCTTPAASAGCWARPSRGRCSGRPTTCRLSTATTTLHSPKSTSSTTNTRTRSPCASTRAFSMRSRTATSRRCQEGGWQRSASARRVQRLTCRRPQAGITCSPGPSASARARSRGACDNTRSCSSRTTASS